MFFAALFNPKARTFVNGRKGLFQKLIKDFEDHSYPLAWFHCASLGEFEQGRPIIEQFKKEFPSYKILLTFFSPSGYEVQKNYHQADFVYYLPWDTSDNAKRFVAITKPSVAFFIKYEFWYNYTRQLSVHHIPILSISSIFRKEQVFFKFYGSKFRSMLGYFNHFFVQNGQSSKLLQSIDVNRVTVAGDTRFDRVYEATKKVKDIPLVKAFKRTETTFVVGSCWPEDLAVLAPHIDNNIGKLKFIIAPHEIKESFLSKIETSLDAKTIRYSKINNEVSEYDVLLIDNVGMLASLYQYGEFAYIGGGFGKGLHNILEAACYGIPVFFGNKNYKKFQEANELIMRGGAFEVSDYADLKTKYESLMTMPESYLLAAEVTKSYIAENIGATQKVINYCHTLLDKP